MLHKLYTLFIAPRQRDEDTRNREIVLNVLLCSTLIILLLSLPIFLFNYFIVGQDQAVNPMLLVSVVTVFVGSLYGLSRGRFYRTAAFLLVGVYFLLASVLVFQWGVNIPTGVMLFGLVIVLSGILLGANYSLYAALAVCVLLFMVQIAVLQDVLHPDLAWNRTSPRIGDVIGFSLIYAIVAVTSWLFNYQMERSLRRARRAEAALTRQKQSLETTVEKRTAQLQAAQLEKMQQMYRFAELGQLSTALLHELANHLTTLTLDIEGLEEENRSRMLSKVKRTIHYMDDMVLRVRDQLHGKSSSRPFNVVTEMNKVVAISMHKAGQVRVGLSWEPPVLGKKKLRCHGEPTRFRQLIANLISNAIDAYGDAESGRSGPREVLVTLQERTNQIVITVNDWGRGIAKADRSKLFEAFYSTKKTGMGMGLFIARRIAEQDLRGSLSIDPAAEHTTFVLKLPKA